MCYHSRRRPDPPACLRLFQSTWTRLGSHSLRLPISSSVTERVAASWEQIYSIANSACWRRVDDHSLLRGANDLGRKRKEFLRAGAWPLQQGVGSRCHESTALHRRGIGHCTVQPGTDRTFPQRRLFPNVLESGSRQFNGDARSTLFRCVPYSTEVGMYILYCWPSRESRGSDLVIKKMQYNTKARQAQHCMRDTF